MEWDLQASADGVPMVVHDETLERTTDGLGRVDTYTQAELSDLDAGSWFDPAFAGEPLPALSEVLDAVGARAHRLYPEIKVGASPKEVDRILREVENRELLRKTVFISMDWDALDRIQAAAPGTSVAYIVEAEDRFEAAIDRARDRPHTLLDPDYRLVLADPDRTARARSLGIEFAVWTVNDPEEAARLARMGVSRFTTNEVERLLEWASEWKTEG